MLQTFAQHQVFCQFTPVQCLVEHIDLVKQLFPSQLAHFLCKYAGCAWAGLWPVTFGLARYKRGRAWAWSAARQVGGHDPFSLSQW
jgi:hypothetical protein